MAKSNVITTEQFEALKKEVNDCGLYRQEEFEMMIFNSTESSYDFDTMKDGFIEDFNFDLNFCCEELKLNEKDLTDDQWDELRAVWTKANKKAFELACEKEGVEYEGGYEFSNQITIKMKKIMNRLETKTYRLIAHLADGDIEIKPKGKNKFSTLNEAVEARNEHLDMCDDIDIVVETK